MNLSSLWPSGLAPAWDGTGREFDSWQCRIYIQCSLSLGLLGFLRGSLSTYTEIVFKKVFAKLFKSIIIEIYFRTLYSMVCTAGPFIPCSDVLWKIKSVLRRLKILT